MYILYSLSYNAQLNIDSGHKNEIDLKMSKNRW